MLSHLDMAAKDVIGVESLSARIAENSNLVCYLSQQSIEKQIKHALATRVPTYADTGRTPPFTHKLPELLCELEGSGLIALDDGIIAAAGRLTSFEAASRYPYDEEVTAFDARVAMNDHNHIANLLCDSGLECILIDIEECPLLKELDLETEAISEAYAYPATRPEGSVSKANAEE